MQGDRGSVVERLTSYDQRFTEIMDLIGDRTLSGVEKERAQHLLRELKDDLGEECKRMDTIRGTEALTDVERAFYKPAIFQTHAELRVKTNSIPNHQWHSNLYGARINIRHKLHELRRPPK